MQHTLVRRVMPHRLAKLKQDVRESLVRLGVEVHIRHGRMVDHSGVHPNLSTVFRRIGDRVHLLLLATKDVNPNEEFFFDYGVRSDDEGSRLSFLMT